MKLDILAFGAHPDDVELSCSGAILAHISQGKKVGIVDLTRGELGTRGTPAIRTREAKSSAKILGILVRENLNFADGFFSNDKKHQLQVIKIIRKYQPEIIFANAIDDRHPDHSRAAKLVEDAVFLSGLQKIKTQLNGKSQLIWRPKIVYHYIQDRFIAPDILVDISSFMDKKMEAIFAFKSQFHNLKSTESPTYISSPEFLESIIARAKTFGQMLGVKYAEGFTTKRKVGVKNLFHLL